MPEGGKPARPPGGQACGDLPQRPGAASIPPLIG